MARLDAIREASRGVYLIHEARSEHGPRVSTAALNLGIDVSDAAMFVALAADRPQLRRASVTLTLFAGGVSVLWERYLGPRSCQRARPAVKHDLPPARRTID